MPLSRSSTPLFLAAALTLGLTASAAADMPPGHFGKFLAGQFAQSEKRIDEASDFLSGVLSADRSYTPLTRQAFALAMAAGHWERARSLAQELPEDSPEYALAQTLIALDAFRAGSYVQARRIASRINDRDLGRFTAPLIDAWSAAAAMDREGALAALDRLSSIGALDALGRLQEALLLDHLGDTEKAAAAFETVIDNPHSARGIQYAAAFLQRQGAKEDAAAALAAYDDNPALLALAAQYRDTDATAFSPLTPAEGLSDALLDLSGLLRGRQSGELHLIMARLAAHLAPRSENARFLLGEALRNQGHDVEAVEVFAGIGTGSHLFRLARQQVALAKERSGRAADAEQALRDLIDDGGDQLDTRLLLGNMLSRAERYDEAVPVYRAARRRIDDLEPRHWTLMYSLGMALERLGRWDEAEEALLTALELNPDQPLVLNYLGYSWADQGRRLQRALEMIEQAVEQRPHDGFITDSLGWVYYRLGRYREAVETLEKAVVFEPDDAVINDHLGDAYWRVGRRHEARFQWERAARTAAEDGDDELLEAIRQKLSYGLDENAQAAR